MGGHLGRALFPRDRHGVGTWEPWDQAQSFPALEPPLQESQSNVKFVQDTSKFWYKPHLSRDQGEKPAWPPLPPSRALSGLCPIQPSSWRPYCLLTSR